MGVGGNPHRRVAEGAQVGCEECVEAFTCTGQEEGAHHQNQEANHQKRDGHDVDALHTFRDTCSQDRKRDDPHDCEWDEDAGHESRGEQGTIGWDLQVIAGEEAGCIAAPPQIE